jgi:hypothetical protein
VSFLAFLFLGLSKQIGLNSVPNASTVGVFIINISTLLVHYYFFRTKIGKLNALSQELNFNLTRKVFY